MNSYLAVAAALFLLTPLVRAAAPVVSNISAAQRAGTQLVDTDITDAPIRTVTVSNFYMAQKFGDFQ